MKHWFLYLGWTLWRDHMKSLFCRDWSNDALIFIFGTDDALSFIFGTNTLRVRIFIFGTNTLMGTHEFSILSEVLRWHTDLYILGDKHSDETRNLHSVGNTPMTHWFLYLGQMHWRDHMKSSFCRNYSNDTLNFIFWTNTLKRSHEITASLRVP